MDNSKSTKPIPGSISYQDFDPAFSWVEEEGSSTLRIHLPGFARDNLRVEVDDYGNLMTSGERPLDSTRRSRFSKVFRIPEDCNADDIHAKFENEVLYVFHPKVKATRVEPEPEPKPGPQPEPKPKPEAEQQYDMNRQANERVSGEPALKQAEEKIGEVVDTTQKDAGKIVDKEKDRTAGPSVNGKADVEGDEGIKRVDEGKTEARRRWEVVAEGEAETGRYARGGPVVGPTKPMQPLLNVAAAILVLACLMMYVAYKLGKASG